MAKPVYREIADHIVDGVLEEDFSLPDEKAGMSPLRFAPGAMDGMCIYHLGYRELDGDAAEQMAAAVKTAAEGDCSGADTLFHEWTEEHRTVMYVDDLQEYVLAHAQELDPNRAHGTAMYLVLQSVYIECVKVGLVLLELFGEPEERIKEIIRRLGLYDEFTLFSAWNMRTWENGNAEIFSLARKTHSWGRIHAVDCLEPETEEIRRWLLTQGTVNEVMHAYSALTCWQKSGAETVLSGHPAPGEFAGIMTLIAGLLDEGPVPGISKLENAEGILLRFLELVPAYSQDIDAYELVLSVREWAERQGAGLPPVIGAADRILQSPPCRAAVGEAVKEGRGLGLAKELDIPFCDQLLAYMRRDFDSGSLLVGHLMKEPAYLEPVLALYREKLPLEKMKGDPAEDPCMGRGYEDYDRLQFLIQELEDKPLAGADFVKAALESPAFRNRYRALAVLQAWVRTKGTPLSALLPEIYEEVRRLRDKETSRDNQEMILALLEGRTAFPDEGEDEEREE